MSLSVAWGLKLFVSQVMTLMLTSLAMGTSMKKIHHQDLFLSPFNEEDYQDIQDLLSDEVVMKWVGTGGPWSKKEIDLYFHKQLERAKESPLCMYAARDASSGKFVGECGFQHLELDGDKIIELGYTLSKSFWGLGYATLMGEAMLDLASMVKIEEVHSIIAVKNLASQRVSQKLGFHLKKVSHFSGQECCIYHIKL